MAYDIGPKIGIEGEKAFRNNINKINTSMRTLKTEMQSVSSQFDKNEKSQESYTAKNEVLVKQIDLQKDKLEELKKGLSKAAEKYGDTDVKTQRWQQSVNKATTDLNLMERELKSNEKAIDKLVDEFEAAERGTDDLADSMDNLGDEMDDAQDKSKKFTGALGGIASGLTSIGGVAGKAAVTAITAVATAAGAAIGGITSFANDSQKAMNDFIVTTGATQEEAEEFKGVMDAIYANNYGESYEDIADAMAKVKTVTGETGDQLQKTTEQAILMRDSFDFDIEGSINTANTLMKTFEISAERAYEIMALGAQNGADKNGDLLDILNEYAPQFQALGFSENSFLETLVEGADAGLFSMDKLGDAVKEFNIRSKDMSDASADAFESLGFDADEMFKAFAAGGDDASMAFQSIMEDLQKIEDPLEVNRLGVALFGTTFEDLEAGAVDVLANLDGHLKDSEEAVWDMTGSLEAMADVKYNDLGSAIEGLKRQVLSNLSPVTDIATDMISNIVNAAKSGDVAGIGTALAEGVTGMVDEIVPMIPTVINSLSTAIQPLLTSIMGILPDLAPVAVDILMLLGDSLIQAVPDILPLLVTTVVTLITSFAGLIIEQGPILIDVAMQSILTLVDGLIEALPMLIEMGLVIMMALVDALLEALPELIPMAIEAMSTYYNALIDAIPMLIEAAPKIISALVTAIIDNFPMLVDAAIQIIVALVTTIVENLPLILEAGVEILLQLVAGALSALSEIWTIMPRIKDELEDSLKSIDWGQLGKNMITGIVDGVSNAAGNLTSSVKNAATNALDGVKKRLDINSPSRVFRDEVGEQIGAGMAEGITRSASKVTKAMSTVDKQLTGKSYGSNGSGSGSGSGESNIYVESPDIYLDGEKVSKSTGRSQYKRNKSRSRGLGVVPAT